MRILVDTDILLDVALGRVEHVEASAAVLSWVESGGEGAIAWHSIANCAYLLKGGGRAFIESLLTFIEIAEVGTADARFAMGLPMPDLEDALQAASAMSWQADYIITRNLRHYRKSPKPALTPVRFLKSLKEG